MNLRRSHLSLFTSCLQFGDHAFERFDRRFGVDRKPHCERSGLAVGRVHKRLKCGEDVVQPLLIIRGFFGYREFRQLLG